MHPHCDPDLEDNKPIFLHDALDDDDESPHQVYLKRLSSSEATVQTKPGHMDTQANDSNISSSPF